MSDEAVKIEITGRIDGKIAKSIRDIAKAAIEADSNLDLLRQSLKDISNVQALRSAVNDTREFRNEVNRATQSQRAFAQTNSMVGNSLRKSATDADKYALSLKKVDAANARLTSGYGNLRSAVAPLVGMFASIFAVQQYAQAQDALTNIQNKIRSLTEDYTRQRDIQESLFEVANRTRSSVEATTDGFVRFSKAMKDASDEEVLRFVETLNKSLISAGRTTSEVNSIVIQLGQALTSGRLMGDEFRSLSENLPREALEAIARQLGTTVENLKKLSSEGVITTDVLRKAFGNLADSMDEAFARTIPTIGQSLTVLSNNFIAFTESSSGAAALVSQAIIFIAENLNLLLPLIIGLAAAWAAVQLFKVAADFAMLTGEIIRFTTVFIVANALTIAWLAIIGLVITAALTLAYTIAKLTGNGEAFTKWIASSIKTVQQMTSDLLGLKDGTGLATEAQKAFAGAIQGVQATTSAASGSMTGLTAATNDNKVAVKDWAANTTKAVNAVASAYNNLSAVKRAALAEGGKANYESLVKAGGKSGSFEALPAFGKPGNNGSSITTLPRLARGGSGIVGGTGRGVDRNLVAFRANRGERVDVSTKAQQRRQGGGDNGAGAPVMVFNITTPNADSFRRSRGQIASDMIASMT